MKCNAVISGDSRAGFTLIEVVLAVGIFVFAIVSIFGLFGTSLQSDKQVTDEDEALGIARALPAFFQTKGFNTVYGWIQNPSGAPALYGYYLPPGSAHGAYSGNALEATVASSTDSILTSGSLGYLHRQGRLFSIQIALSPNMPLHLTTSSTTATIMPTASQLATSSSNYGESILPIRASIYAVSATNAALGQFPVFAYDTAVSR